MSRKNSTRQLIGIDDIKNDSVVTADGELAFYFVPNRAFGQRCRSCWAC